jgi:two-component system, OmpR family, sensor kinase
MRADVSPDADQLSGDPDRLEQVVENLVANALRYVPDGGTIALGAAVSGRTALLRVVDTGPGIAPEHLAHVFDRFYKGDPARVATGNRQAGSGQSGSGLGLSIVKAIVERHGGRIAVSSVPGRTVFTVTLPDASVSEAGPGRADRATDQAPASYAGHPPDVDRQKPSASDAGHPADVDREKPSANL